jgi:hypothetical protein
MKNILHYLKRNEKIWYYFVKWVKQNKKYFALLGEAELKYSALSGEEE